MKTKSAFKAKVKHVAVDAGTNAHAASVPDDEWEKLRPFILKLFLDLQNSRLD